MNKYFKNCFYFTILLILLGGFLVWGLMSISFTEKEIDNLIFPNYLKIKHEKPEIIPDFINPHTKSLVVGVNLNIPFTSQAPYAIWDELHDRACEEAAIIMVYYYLTKKSLTLEIAEREILNLVDWQMKNWGGHFDLSVEKIIELFENYFGSTSFATSSYQNIELVYDFKVDDIKKELFSGNPIIVPAAGRLLGNPHFTPPGPEYHILVIKGYDDKKSEFIVNDPGTKHGADFRYKYQILETAIHDFNQGDVLNGRKVMIVVKK